MPRYLIMKKVNMFTTAMGVDVPVLEVVSVAESIPLAADQIATRHRDGEVPEDTYFITEKSG
ncbi:hypothetical protein [Roseibium sp. RKSG952]|uniref:hypothetical protein n=1 Tax=Roseibium sp. RKSG952 TaxID=2529384 RepID=UPI0012BC55C5|nr:hypothetical protein [Roseibium sp. RKSG952]MTH95108.1 hypothetical protein [Roseibium sp. RKSG952]